MTQLLLKTSFSLGLLGCWVFSSQAQPGASKDLTRQVATATALQKAGVISANCQLQLSTVGFRVDTSRQACISCDALFMEFVRSHTTAVQLAAILHQGNGDPAIVGTSATAVPEPFTTVFKPLVVDDLLFVLVETKGSKGRTSSAPTTSTAAITTAFLVVLQETNGTLSIVEQSPQCRLRTAADRHSGKSQDCNVSK